MTLEEKLKEKSYQETYYELNPPDPLVIQELNGSEALFGFCGWLTTRDEQTIMSAKDNCSPIVELIKKFRETNNLPEVRDGWDKILIHPKS
ncbi:MAG: hypothetical protein ABIJ40_00460 [Bacteroidota bacterium]